MKLRSVTALLITAAMLTGVGLFAGCNGANDHFLDKLDQGPTIGGIKTGAMRTTLKRGDRERWYGVFVPYNYDPNKKYPAIVFLHGLGEGGSDARANLRVGLAPFVADAADRFQFICIFPQSPSGGWSENSEEAKDIITALDDVSKKYSVDQDRVCLTGLSTGGYGTYAIGAQYIDRFAALAPMGSNGDYNDVARLKNIPIYAIANSGDILAHDRGMIERIQAAGNHNAKYEEYDAGGHDCWERAYSEGTLFRWLLNQRRTRPAAAAPTASTPVASAQPVVAPAPVAVAPVRANVPAAAMPATVETPW